MTVAESYVNVARVIEDGVGQCAIEMRNKAKKELEWIRGMMAESEE